ncbi:MAG: hypothetical protein ACOVNL_02385 [Prochlorococcaceae cyanobacterium]|jgi:hypothetical protein
MSFDAHSLERLRELGRRLPERLPAPEPRQQAPEAPKASERRHRVETEEDPEELFRELMRVSPDGNVPPHLLDRLRQLEAGAQRPQASAGAGAAAAGGPDQKQAASARRQGGTRKEKGKRSAGEDAPMDLYVAFQQLLLEDEEN